MIITACKTLRNFPYKMQFHSLKKSCVNFSRHGEMLQTFPMLKGNERVRFLCGNNNLEFVGFALQLGALRQAPWISRNEASVPWKSLITWRMDIWSPEIQHVPNFINVFRISLTYSPKCLKLYTISICIYFLCHLYICPLIVDCSNIWTQCKSEKRYRECVDTFDLPD